MVSSELIKNPETLLIVNVLKKRYEASSLIVNSSRVDWHNVYRKTVDWGVLNKFYANILETELSKLIPEETREKFEKFYYFSTARNSLLMKIFFNISELLNNENIKILPIKGLGLIFKVYSNIWERFTSDIDILVKQDDILKAEHLLKRNGFTKGIDRNTPLWHTQLIDKNGIEIELHYKIPNIGGNSAIMEVFNNSELISEKFFTCLDETNPFFLSSVNKLKFNVPSTEDLLIIQSCSINLANAFGQGSIIKTCLDYMVAIEKSGDDWQWNVFFERAERFGASNYVLFILAFLHHIFRYENELSSQHFVLNRNTRLRWHDIFAWFMRDGDISCEPQISSLYKFFTSGKFNDFIRHFKYALVPKKEKIVERYKIKPNSLKIYLYYFIRAFELIKTKLNFRTIFFTIKLARFLRQKNSH